MISAQFHETELNDFQYIFVHIQLLRVSMYLSLYVILKGLKDVVATEMVFTINVISLFVVAKVHSTFNSISMATEILYYCGFISR